ncbi:hypothetical protein DL766_004125 [Monosporascus sp. MC13-8B]|uniref:Glycosyl hydrolase family 13 catalytic domain-containing protein n=1 Tax=Monosporascus cannonballus TaxID=155416 RepID=A0ABY0HIX7_9PEZI|nr:hypothetical protein DL762_000818 [Monosporascus cannonballus]RYO96363.1 hypothetical protein DL763_003219 [Monosporascus cannonballus]RYP32118.1 hypothetical protein DL766_004125 [Monosporascus sp. MC13-8B]
MSENDATPENGTMLRGLEMEPPQRLATLRPPLQSAARAEEHQCDLASPGCRASSPEVWGSQFRLLLCHRNKAISDPHEIVAWLGFEFAGCGDKYSKQKYHWYHVSGTDYDSGSGRNGIFRIEDKSKDWSESVDDKQDNDDFFMFADLDCPHPEVVEDVKRWGRRVVGEAGLAGFRLDAVQRLSERFTREWIER